MDKKIVSVVYVYEDGSTKTTTLERILDKFVPSATPVVDWDNLSTDEYIYEDLEEYLMSDGI